MAPCHAGQLLGLTCQTEDASSKRVCNACLAAFGSGLEIPGDRCRILPQPCGTFGGRSFYSTWTCGNGTIDGVRPLKLASDGAQLLVFVDAMTALMADQLLPGLLLRSTQESMTLRSCGGSKSFCPSSNFELTKSKTCRAHLAFVAGGKRQRTSNALAHPPAANHQQSVTLDDIERLLRDPAMPAAPVTSPEQTEYESPPRDVSPSHECEPCSIAEPPASMTPLLDGLLHGANALAAPVQETGSLGGVVQPVLAEPVTRPLSAESLELQLLVAAQMDVSQRLFAHGETLKAGGSSQWTVVSDARLKNVVATFDMGMGELVQLQPRVFRYKDGLAMGADPDKLYVGLLAQEVPDRLAQFCRVSARVRLREEDIEETEIFMLDHSCLQFVTMNAIREVEREHRSSFRQVQQRLDGGDRWQSEAEERLTRVEGQMSAAAGSKQQQPTSSTYGCRASCFGLEVSCGISPGDGDVTGHGAKLPNWATLALLAAPAALPSLVVACVNLKGRPPALRLKGLTASVCALVHIGLLVQGRRQDAARIACLCGPLLGVATVAQAVVMPAGSLAADVAIVPDALGMVGLTYFAAGVWMGSQPVTLLARFAAVAALAMLQGCASILTFHRTTDDRVLTMLLPTVDSSLAIGALFGGCLTRAVGLAGRRRTRPGMRVFAPLRPFRRTVSPSVASV